MVERKGVVHGCIARGQLMRVSISKPQHRAIIQAVASQLGSDKPMDGLEHILNCWLVGNIPPTNSSTQLTAPIAATESDDEFSALMEF